MRAFRFLFLSCFLFYMQPAQAATTILPPAKTCFSTATGAVVAGTVNMFQPGTTIPKATWQDSTQTALNPNPIVLDANGCALIFGVGAYRQQLFTSGGSLIFDAVTTDTSAYNQVFWAGISGGTPNVITVVDPGFNGTDGTVINFTALATNTGSTTINPSGFGAISVVKDTAAGPVSLSGGEIIQNNIISVVYSASGNNFHLLNTAIPSASGNSAPLCGATNLRIVNDSGTPNSIISITADTALLVTPAGVVINRTNISQSINISTGTVTSTAGGMDGESPGVSGWIYIWLVDNGAAPAGLGTLASGNGLTPNMPSGYTYKCRLGAMRVDGAGVLLRTRQLGKQTQYTVVPATNTATFPSVASGAAGDTTAPTYVTVALTSVVPATASIFNGIGGLVNNAVGSLILNPNGNTGGITTTTNPPLLSIVTSAGGNTQLNPFSMIMETQNISWASSGASGRINATGWVDQVNAN